MGIQTQGFSVLRTPQHLRRFQYFLAMKKLELKSTPTVEQTPIGEIILEKAREEIKEHIRHKLSLLYYLIYGDMPNYGEGEDVRVCTGDLEDVFIYVDTDSADMNNIVKQRVEIVELGFCLDGTVLLWNENGDEWTDRDVSIEDLAKIASMLERRWSAAIKNI